MSVDPVTISSALPKGTASSAIPAAGDGGTSFKVALADVNPAASPGTPPAAQAPGAVPPSQPAGEVSRTSLPGGGNRLGDQILSRIERLHQGDLAVRAPVSEPNRPGAVATVLPQGPASGNLRAASPTSDAKPAEGTDGFQSQLKNLKDMYDQAIQVSLMTKSTGALSGTVNKLMSAQ